MNILNAIEKIIFIGKNLLYLELYDLQALTHNGACSGKLRAWTLETKP